MPPSFKGVAVAASQPVAVVTSAIRAATTITKPAMLVAVQYFSAASLLKHNGAVSPGYIPFSGKSYVHL